jgi:carbohydrate kinase (thermoresistant glucokinase family)
MTHRVYIIMGVSGCGKTTIGQALAQKLELPFFDGDDFHTPENVMKMASGTPLTDADRAPWLKRLHGLAAEYLSRGAGAVIACSALKQRYREQLRDGLDSVQFVYLHGSFDLIWARMAVRADHYMKADMLRSQFDALEAPTTDEALIFSVEDDPETMVACIIKALG